MIKTFNFLKALNFTFIYLFIYLFVNILVKYSCTVQDHFWYLFVIIKVASQLHLSRLFWILNYHVMDPFSTAYTNEMIIIIHTYTYDQ